MKIKNFDNIIDLWNEYVYQNQYHEDCKIDIAFINDAKRLSTPIHNIVLIKPEWGITLSLHDATKRKWKFRIYNTLDNDKCSTRIIDESLVVDKDTFIKWAQPIIINAMGINNLYIIYFWAEKHIEDYLIDEAPPIKPHKLQILDFIKAIKRKFGISLKIAKKIADDTWDVYKVIKLKITP